MLKLLYYVNPQREEIFGQGEIMDNELDMIKNTMFSGRAYHEFAAVWKQLFRHYKLKRRTSNLSCGVSGQLLMTHVAYSKV